MRDKIRIELSSESRLGWEPFYAVLDLPATAQQIRDARQKARITGREDMTYQSVTMVEFEPLPNLEHIRLDTTSVEELNYLAQRLDSLSDEQFTIYQALFDQRFGNVDFDELLSVKDLINMTYGLDSVMVASNIHNDEQLGQFVIENDLHPDVAAIPDDSLYLLDKRRIGELQRKNEGGVLIEGFYVVTGDYEIPEVYDGKNMFSVPRGYTDGFNQWCKQVAAICLTAFMQTTLLFLGLLTFPDHMLLGLGIMLAANEVPRIAQQFGLDSSVKVNMMSVVHATTTAVNLTRSVARATGK